MKIAVLGCGAIGGLFLGYLSDAGLDVIGIVKEYQKEALEKEGLIVEGIRGSDKYRVKVDTRLTEKVDLVIFAVKVNDLEDVIKDNIDYLKDTTLMTTQNGIEADYILEKHFPKNRIITATVMFGSTFYAPNKVVHNFGKDLVLGGVFGAKPDNIEHIKELLNPVFDTTISDNMKGAKYLKIFVNLNNCIPAVLGLSMQEAFADLDCAKLAIRLNKEAYAVIKNSEIELADLPSYPKQRIEGLVSMDIDAAAELFSKIMASLSKEPLYGSILQSIRRLRASEIDYINGEIVFLARKHGIDASLNEKIIELVHKVEDTGKFLSKKELLEQFK